MLERLTQIVAEDVHNKANIRRNLKQSLEENIDKEFLQAAIDNIDAYLYGDYYASKEKRLDHIRHLDAEEIMLETMTVMCSVIKPVTIQNPATKIGSKFEYPDIFDGVKTAAELIVMCARAGLVRIFSPGIHSDSISVQSNINLDQDILDFLEKIRYPNPMVCKPDNWHANTGGGYITSCDSILLGKQTHHDDYQAVDALNILQSVAWELDREVLKEEEVPNKPFVDAFFTTALEQEEAFNQMVRISCKVYEEIGEDPFYYPCKYDFRGRIYTSGHYLNFQATSYKKALHNFVKKEKVR